MPEESKSWPFSSYDFFGYLMPGLIFSLSLYGWLLYAKFDFIHKIHYKRLIGLEIGDSIIVLLIIVASCYFLGHLIGAISHILYDRMLIRNCIGYPFPYLFNAGNPPSDLSRASYCISFLCFGLLLVIPGIFEMYFSYWNSEFAIMWGDGIGVDWDLLKKYSSYLEIVIFIVLMILIVVASDLKMRKTSLFENNNCLKQKCQGLKDLIFTPFRSLTATDSFVSETVVQNFSKRMMNEYGLSLEKQNSDVFWLATLSLSKDPVIEGKLRNWLNLYGCLRNYSCAFLLLAIIIVSNHWFKIFTEHQVTGLAGSRILLMSLVLSMILFLRYWIIYFSYYSKYIIRSYAYFEKGESENRKNLKEKIVDSIRFHF